MMNKIKKFRLFINIPIFIFSILFGILFVYQVIPNSGLYGLVTGIIVSCWTAVILHSQTQIENVEIDLVKITERMMLRAMEATEEQHQDEEIKPHVFAQGMIKSKETGKIYDVTIQGAIKKSIQLN